MEQTTKIGWVGTGIMGTAMAGNLLKNGFDVRVYNRTVSKTKALVDAGAKIVSQPNELWKHCSAVFVMLTDNKACEEMFTMKNGILDIHNSDNGKVIVNSSTISPETSVVLSKLAAQKNIGYLDAPVSGSAGAAKQASLLFLVGGAKNLFEHMIPILQTMGKKSYYLGNVSNGNKAKLAINYLVAVNYLAIGEAVHFAEKMGIAPKDMMDIINNSGVGNMTSSTKTESIVRNDFSNVAFALDNMLKDIRLAKEEGNDMPLSDALLETYENASRDGYGQKDVMEIISYLRKGRQSS